jgi:hypothetical protein
LNKLFEISGLASTGSDAVAAAAAADSEVAALPMAAAEAPFASTAPAVAVSAPRAVAAGVPLAATGNGCDSIAAAGAAVSLLTPAVSTFASAAPWTPALAAAT